MDSLRSFMDEMLNDQGRKEGFISDLLGNLKNQPIPTLEQAQTGYTTVSNLHGIFYDYDKAEVTISYKVVPDMYPPYTLSFYTISSSVRRLINLAPQSKVANAT